MNEEKLFLLKKEVGRLLKDFSGCSDPICKELIREDVIFLCSVLANQHVPEI